MSPKRIQMRRTKGWRKPEGVIVVARPSRWGNPYKVGTPFIEGPGEITPALAMVLFAMTVNAEDDPRASEWREEIRKELRGHDLACWCPLDQPCHADVLLEVANA